MISSIRLFACSAAMTLCASHAQAMSVTFVNPGKQGERFWDMVTETMQAAADDFDIELEVVYAQRNRVRMAELGVEVTQRETPPDYLVLVNEEQAAERILLSANQRNIRTLMLLNDFLPEQRQRVGQPGDQGSKLLGAITPDNFGAGKRMMNALFKCADAKYAPPHHILAIGGDQLTPASIDRNNGAVAALKSAEANTQLDRFLFANWNQKEAQNLTQRYLSWAERNNIQPAAIWAANDPIAFGAREALKQQGLKPGKDVCLVGLNWSAQGLKLVQSGEMLLTDGGHFLAGAWSMVLLNDYNARLQRDERSPVGPVRFQMQSIDKTNIERYLSKLGDENWGKIDFTQFSRVDQSGYSDYDFSLDHVLNAIDR